MRYLGICLYIIIYSLFINRLNGIKEPTVRILDGDEYELSLENVRHNGIVYRKGNTPKALKIAKNQGNNFYLYDRDRNNGQGAWIKLGKYDNPKDRKNTIYFSGGDEVRSFNVRWFGGMIHKGILRYGDANNEANELKPLFDIVYIISTHGAEERSGQPYQWPYRSPIKFLTGNHITLDDS